MVLALKRQLSTNWIQVTARNFCKDEKPFSSTMLSHEKS